MSVNTAIEAREIRGKLEALDLTIEDPALEIPESTRKEWRDDLQSLWAKVDDYIFQAEEDL